MHGRVDLERNVFLAERDICHVYAPYSNLLEAECVVDGMFPCHRYKNMN